MFVNVSTLRSPEGVFFVGEELIVADTGNHRVLIWTTFPTANGQPADVVLGQADFNTLLSNRGLGAATANSLALPSAVHVERDTLFVADTGNNRVLGFPMMPPANGIAAGLVLGQPSFSERVPTADINNGSRLAGPVALASDGANLFVADRDANRVLAFALADRSSANARILFNANSGLISVGPSGLAVERTPFWGSTLYVADTTKDQLLVVGNVSRLR